MTEEVKEKVKKEPKKFHHLYDWVLLAVALLVVLGGAGYYLLSEYNVLNLELGDKYRVTVSVPTKKTDAVTPSNDEDLKEIDNEINAVTSEDFSEKGLNNQAVGL